MKTEWKALRNARYVGMELKQHKIDIESALEDPIRAFKRILNFEKQFEPKNRMTRSEFVRWITWYCIHNNTNANWEEFDKEFPMEYHNHVF